MRIQSLLGPILISSAACWALLACGTPAEDGASDTESSTTASGTPPAPTGNNGPQPVATPGGPNVVPSPGVSNTTEDPPTVPPGTGTMTPVNPVPTPGNTGVTPVDPPDTAEPVGTDDPPTDDPTMVDDTDMTDDATVDEPTMVDDTDMTDDVTMDDTSVVEPEPVVGDSVPESADCPDIVWPTAEGSTDLGGGITVGGGEVYDGEMAVHEGSLENCAAGDQDSTDPLIEVADGGTVRNVIMGSNVGDGIHCLGSCTIENVWFPNVCDDAISALGSGTVNISNSGFKNARDKVIQHNGTGTVNIDTVYVETAGKLYRSCGEGCDGSNRSATLSNVVAIGVDQIAGVSTEDTVTLSNICVHRSFAICAIYEPGTSDETTSGVNGSNEGPSANCNFTSDDTHALLSRVSGIPFTTDVVCGGPNAYKSGSTATTCVEGFDKCLKACMPGGYGFKELTCTDGRYAEGTGTICAMPVEPTAAQNLAEANVSGATNMVDGDENCSTEWDVGIEASNNANFCVCVHKPGYYSFDNWLAWDCQRRWW